VTTRTPASFSDFGAFQELKPERRSTAPCARNPIVVPNAFPQEGVVMQQLKITLRRNEEEQTLSLEINGKIYDSVDIEIAIELVKQALIQAEESLIKSRTRYSQ
jgi:hypothetical protein